MKTFLFSVKHMLRTPLFFVLTALVLLLPPLLYAVGNHSSIPKTVYVLEDPEDPESQRMASYLDHEGFEPVSDEATLRKGLCDGTIDSGILIPADFSERLESHDVEGILRVLFTPTTLLPNIKKEEITAALFSVYAPYLTGKSLEGTGITLEEVLDEYHRRMGDSATLVFTFDIIEESGAPVQEAETGRRFFLGALSLLLFLALYFAVASPLFDRFRSISERIGRKAAFFSILLPGSLLRAFVLALAAFFASLFAGQVTLLPGILLFIALVTVVHYLLLALPGGNWKDIAVLFFAAFSLVLCPIFLDLSLFYHPLRVIRFFVPPYWLWFFAGV